MTDHIEEFRQRNSHLSKDDLADTITAFLGHIPTKKQTLFYKNGRTAIHRGFRDDLGFFVRSAWEANIARYLNWLKDHHEIISWRYEPKDKEFWFPVKRGTRSYLPDFEVTNPDGSVEYWEVKGWMDRVSHTKLNRMKKYHPNVTIILIDQPAYKAIEQKVSKMIPNWEG